MIYEVAFYKNGVEVLRKEYEVGSYKEFDEVIKDDIKVTDCDSYSSALKGYSNIKKPIKYPELDEVASKEREKYSRGEGFYY